MSDYVTVTFKYHPTDPDPADRSGLSEVEYEELTEKLMMLGGEDIEIVKDEEEVSV